MPSSVVDAVKSKTDPECHSTRCSDSGCSLSLNGAPQPYVLISLEHEDSPVKENQPHCDYLFVGGSDAAICWVVPIELTVGKPPLNKFTTQLTAGAAIANDLVPANADVTFRPVGVHNGIHRSVVKHLRRKANYIQFRGKSIAIELLRCRDPLTKALKQ